MENIRTSVSECMNYLRHNKFSANTSVVLEENDKVTNTVHQSMKDKVNFSIIFLIQSGHEVRNVIENELEKQHEEY